MDAYKVLEKLATACIEFDRAWHYVFINQRAEEMIGRRRDQLLGQVLWEEFPDLIGTEAARELHRALDQQIETGFEYFSPVLHRWVHVQAIPADGGLCVFLHDTTKRREAEEKVLRLNRDLVRRVAELQTLLDVAPVGIAVADDPECRNIRVNPAGAAMLGIAPSENASKSAPDAGRLRFKVVQGGRELAPEELPMQFAAAHRVRIQGFEVDVVHEDGRVLNLFEYASPLLDEQGSVSGCLGVFVDISERKRTEEQFQAVYELAGTVAHAENLEDVFQATLNALEHALNAKRRSILLLDDDGIMRLKAWRNLSETYRIRTERDLPWPGNASRIVIENVESAELPAKAAILAEGIRSFVLIPLIGQRRLIGQFMAYFNEPHVFTEAELNLLHTIGYHTAYAIERQVAESDRLRLLERERQSRADAERANQLKDEFLAVVSHEIRTPLTAITGWCHLLRSGRLDAVGVERALETITENARLQTKIIDDILDVSRIITGKFELRKAWVNLLGVVQSAVDSVKPAADQRDIHISLRSSSATVATLGDAIRLQQVVSNVLSNAVKFSPDGSSIKVSIERNDPVASVVVSDAGQGISSDFLPYVFERFRQGDGSTTRRHGGLGLGLAIAKHIVELHGGSITIHSEGAGRGTRAVIELPVTKMDAPVPAPGHEHRQAELPSGTLHGIRILVVDDHAATLDLLVAVLEDESAIVRRCLSASEALAATDGFEPDVLVADIAMPGEDGCALLPKLRAELGRCLPALAVTACTRSEDRDRIREAGFELCLPKPLDPDLLVRAILKVAGSESTVDCR
jgi:PAS domain S-box-containing protein